MADKQSELLRLAKLRQRTRCRVVVLSHGKTIYSTPTRHSRPDPDLHKEIISYQRRWLQKKYPALKANRNVVYKLQWLRDNEWIFDRQ